MKNINSYTQEQLIERFKEIKAMGWVENQRPNNHGGVGNTLEDLLGIGENNLSAPDVAEWELKAQKGGTTSLVTLFHSEPHPRASKFVPAILLPQYGWPHKSADKMSFRQTISANTRSERGFTVVVNRNERKVMISFNAENVHPKHRNWLKNVENKVGLDELSPQPYWEFGDLDDKAGTKLLNVFYVRAKAKKTAGKEYYHYSSVLMLKGFSFDQFLLALDNGSIYVDFDARTGHNHGTKFRLRENVLPKLYKSAAGVL